jgi:hypothetical protein
VVSDMLLERCTCVALIFVQEMYTTTINPMFAMLINV